MRDIQQIIKEINNYIKENKTKDNYIYNVYHGTNELFDGNEFDNNNIKILK